ncbi:alpha/beta hydrolase [Novosphingobium sp. 1949]|uniref:Alpha/beta hydrolase n=1 Tax=Novosphingobium organovorum TaxID=2930092 RepID=A0ABT0BF78_9SPHN|nr:alpha/beta hydrolase [Novosphingobium organovorum]MCJ2183717.1 alpha/beta hydrolase [Novosphingobium organovorum]
MNDAIRALGARLGPDVVGAVRAIYALEQEALAASLAPLLRDGAYGPDPRHRLDLYRTGDDAAPPRPVLLFVHGGGFVLGDKGGATPQDWQNAHVGRWAARLGFVGAVMNYRLAPGATWPSGAEDVGAAVAWLKANVAEFGGDPARIVLMGTSAGATHVAGYIDRFASHASDVRAAILLSGLYGYEPLEARDERYYGPAAGYAERCPRAGLVATECPLFIACAHFDPALFQAEWLGLLAERKARRGALDWGHLANGHTHYSLPMHLGTTDRTLSADLEAFLADHLTKETTDDD